MQRGRPGHLPEVPGCQVGCIGPFHDGRQAPSMFRASGPPPRNNQFLTYSGLGYAATGYSGRAVIIVRRRGDGVLLH
jgi:hypothetical protein